MKCHIICVIFCGENENERSTWVEIDVQYFLLLAGPSKAATLASISVIVLLVILCSLGIIALMYQRYKKMFG